MEQELREANRRAESFEQGDSKQPPPLAPLHRSPLLPFSPLHFSSPSSYFSSSVSCCCSFSPPRAHTSTTS
eukprot:763040-Hanusia_phi.AAC.2